MKLNYNKEKLERTLETFNVITNANICIFDCDFNTIYAYGNFPKFCSMIRKDGKLYQKCLISDKTNALTCSKSKNSITYTCHAGIVETISPIYLDGILLGYIIFGGLRDAENKFSSPETIKNACETYGLDYSEFLSLYEGLPSFNHKELDAYIEILKLCIKNILTENMLQPSSQLLSTKIIHFINENVKSDISVKDICYKFCISEKTLYRIVKKSTGKTVNEYIKEVRLSNALPLLTKTDKSIAEISAYVGINDYNYFIRLFKSEFNITPLKYRKTHKE